MKPPAPVTSTVVSLAMNIAPATITPGVMNEECYVHGMIKSFKSEEAEKIFRGQFSRKLPQAIQRVAARKLEQLHAATVLETLRVPPGNRLEALTHNRQGQPSALSQLNCRVGIR
jgi:toxin HigB-1